MTRLLVLRHGKTTWNLEKRIQGRQDIELCSEGIAELESRQIPSKFNTFRCVTSPLKRARETAALLKASDPRLEQTLIEMDWGDWEGKRLPELRAELGPKMSENEARGFNMTPPHGESPAQVMERLRPWIAELQEDTIAVTHKGVIRAILALSFGWDMKEPFAEKIDWSAAHLFSVSDTKQIKAEQLNISLENL
ncbi:MAG: histidine phosphatase family protein [Proteobacteria bacterium]|nr:histidine phosphatase family protein [Pseudomonadota bacterium]